MIRLALSLILLTLASGAAAKDCAFNRPAYAFVTENDVFAGTDQNYTAGFRFSMTNPPLISDFACRTANWLGDNVLRTVDGAGPVKVGFEFAIGQSMFTPQDRLATRPLPDQHPYAGYLYFELASFALHDTSWFLSSLGTQIFDTFNIQLGIVGPAAGAEWVQDNVHDLINDDRLGGWDNQLQNEPVIAISMERKYIIPLFGEGKQGFGVDVVPNLGITLGNVLVQGSAGATLRMGWSLKQSFGPARVRPAIGGASVYETDHKVAGFVFASAGGRLVGRNIFLDGNTFQDSLSVKKRHLVDDLQAGIVVQFSRVILAFTVVSRGQEFVTQRDRQRFGAISFVWRGAKR